MTGLRSADTTNRLAHLTGNSTILSILSRPYRESLNENLFSWMMRFNGSRHRLICFSASRWVLHLKPAALTVRKRQPPQAHLFLRFPVGLNLKPAALTVKQSQWPRHANRHYRNSKPQSYNSRYLSDKFVCLF